MKRDVQAVVMLLMGVMLARLVMTGQYLYYVSEGMGRWLLVSAAVLGGLGASTLWQAWRDSRDTGSPGSPGPAPTAAVAPVGEGHAGHGGSRIAYLLLLPVLAVYVVAPSPLGSFTASRQGPAAPVARAVVDLPPLPPGDPASLPVRDYVTRAIWDSGRTLRHRTVALTGFVTPDPDGGWWLTRMTMSCCAADAQAFRVKLAGPPPGPADSWVAVTGTWAPGGDTANPVPHFAAISARAVPEPRNPYE